MSNDTHRRAFWRAHDDLFPGSRYNVEFFNYENGSYDPNKGEITGESRTSIGTVQAEVVPPGQDSSVDTDGTSFSWDTSIRVPDPNLGNSDWGTNWGTNWGGEPFTPLGEDNERPTEVEVNNPTIGDTTTYELHSYTTEYGSGMTMIRLVEQ